MQCLPFCDWLIWLSMMSLGPIHVVTIDRIFFFFKGWMIFHCMCTPRVIVHFLNIPSVHVWIWQIYSPVSITIIKTDDSSLSPPNSSFPTPALSPADLLSVSTTLPCPERPVKGQFYFFLSRLYSPYFFFLPVALAGASSAMVRSSGDRRHLCCVPHSRRKALALLPLSVMSAQSSWHNKLPIIHGNSRRSGMWGVLSTWDSVWQTGEWIPDAMRSHLCALNLRRDRLNPCLPRATQ